MRGFPLTLAAATALALQSVLAAGEQTSEQCRTKLGKKSVWPIPTWTSYQTVVNTFTTVSTRHQHTTVTPPASTFTNTIVDITHTTVARNTATDTVQVVATTVQTSTKTVMTQTVTVVESTSTNTVSTPTSTIPTASGYVPIQSSYPGSQWVDSDGNPMDFDSSSLKKAKRRPLIKGRAASSAPKSSSPIRVDCVITSYVAVGTTVIQQGKPITITAPTPIQTKDLTTTVIVTDTSYPPRVTVRTTSIAILTQTDTIFTSTKTTTTTITTNTIIAPSATIYAQCMNQADYADYAQTDSQSGSLYWNGGSDDLNRRLNYVDVDSPPQCCQYCAGDPICEFSAFIPISRAGTPGFTCAVVEQSNGACDPDCNGRFEPLGSIVGDFAAVFNNGNLGQVLPAT